MYASLKHINLIYYGMKDLPPTALNGRVDMPLARPAPHGTGRASFSHLALCKAYFVTLVSVNTDIDPWFGKWEALQQFCEAGPVVAPPLAPSAEPFE